MVQINYERRQFRRIPFNREVEVIGIGTFQSSNLSPGGLYLKTGHPFSLGNVFDLSFKLRDTDELPITLQACVLYLDEKDGIGLAFIDLSLEDHERMEKFIDQNKDMK